MTGLRFERWEEREAGVLGTLPYVLLAICLARLAFAASARPTRTARSGSSTALSAATAAWMLWWTVLHRDWRERPRLMVVYFVGLIPLMAALVIIAPWYGFFTFTGYFSVALLPERVWPVRRGRASRSSRPRRRTAACRTARRLDRHLRAHHHRERRGGQRDHVLRLGRRAGPPAARAARARSSRRRCARTRRCRSSSSRVRARTAWSTSASGWRASCTTRSRRASPGSSRSSRRPSRRAATRDWRRHLDAARDARARQPHRGAAVGARDAPGAAGGRAAAGRARGRGAALERAARRAAPTSRRRATRGRCARRSRSRCCGRRRRRSPTSPSTPRPCGSASRCPTWTTS